MAPPQFKPGKSRTQAAQMVTGKASYTTLERIAELQRFVADPGADHALKEKASEELTAHRRRRKCRRVTRANPATPRAGAAAAIRGLRSARGLRAARRTRAIGERSPRESQGGQAQPTNAPVPCRCDACLSRPGVRARVGGPRPVVDPLRRRSCRHGTERRATGAVRGDARVDRGVLRCAPRRASSVEAGDRVMTNPERSGRRRLVLLLAVGFAVLAALVGVGLYGLLLAPTPTTPTIAVDPTAPVGSSAEPKPTASSACARSNSFDIGCRGIRARRRSSADQLGHRRRTSSRPTTRKSSSMRAIRPARKPPRLRLTSAPTSPPRTHG